jgi:polysaccharide deacetylase 2 family uncharacterized protein YibQ
LGIDLRRLRNNAAGIVGAARRAKPKPWVVGAASAGLVAIALFAWLAIEAPDTMRQIEAAQPRVELSIAKPAPSPDGTPVQAPIPETDSPKTDLSKTDSLPPWRANAQPVAGAPNQPRIAVLMAGLGLSSSIDERAIHKLAGGISLGFLPFSDRIETLVPAARAEGHEVVLSVPMEGNNYPADDPGPQALLTRASAPENLSRLDWDLARAKGYVGIVPSMGERFTASPDMLRSILDELAKRGLLYVDTGSAAFGAAPALGHAIGVPLATSDRTIDAVPTAAAIDRELAALEETARHKGSALGVVSPYPVTFDRLAAWIPTLAAKGIVLVPLSAVTQDPTAAQSGAAMPSPDSKSKS